MVKRGKKKRRKSRQEKAQGIILAGIRKQTAPPTKKFGTRRPPSKIHPARNGTVDD